MKKFSFLLSIVFLMFYHQTKSQIYVQGDITAMANLSGFHDSTNCMSLAQEMYMFTITNSFVGDSIIIKDMSSGMVLASDVNTTGANPWTTTLMPMSMPPIVPDFMLSGGMAFFGGTPMKFINSSDTIFNVISFYQLPVPNPCIYGNVSGQVYIDNNSDCNYNSGDIALQSIPVSAAINFSTGSNSQSAYTGSTGAYSMQLQQSWMTNYSVSIPSNYQFIFPSTACSPASYTFTSLPQTGVDFSLQCTSNVDVQSSAAAPASARPAIPFIVHPYVSNTGCDTASGILTLIKDPNTNYNASLSTNPATYVNGDTLQWNYNQLSNLSTGAYWTSFFAGVHLTPNTSVNIGDTLCFQVSSTILSSDVNPINNQYSFCIPVVNSYDPNAKEVMPKGEGIAGNIPLNTNHLDYTIHFQNTGNAVAFNVSIIDTLDIDIEPSSLRILGASHSMSPQWLAPNVVKFNFSNIMLPDSNADEAKSHGQIRFSVNLKTGLPLGTQIKNKAHIYFDSNPAIVTNTTLNTLANPSSMQIFGNQSSILVYPNPATDELSIQIESMSNELGNVTFYSLNNQLVKQVQLLTKQTKVDIHQLPSGIYIMKVIYGNEYKVLKFVKE
ncbi:MAG: T9SS type A sorting domain-containing protein [Bacteroidetes bacterium]|nr:T9SS type A sorting domain-containing protein [Bacteroidota bacterium]